MTPFVIGLTGPIGCGKTNVLRTLVSLGAEGIDADQVAHEVMAPGGPAYDAVLQAFGRDLLGADGAIDRRQLGARVFSDRAALSRLERIIHPAVARVIAQRAATSRAPVVVVEAIKLIEAGLHETLCDEVWVAVCSEEEQLSRLAASRGMPAEEVRRRTANQMPAEEMIGYADRVIVTDGTMAETAAIVRRLWLTLGDGQAARSEVPGNINGQ